jgi:hypothetical protein
MKLSICVVGVAAWTMLLIGAELQADEKKEDKLEAKIYEPSDGKSFEITSKDTVRFKGPAAGSTGVETIVKVVEGDATVAQRSVYAVKNGQPLTIGGGALEFDVKPGNKGKVKIKVTTKLPGGKTEEKDFEFEVK